MRILAVCDTDGGSIFAESLALTLLEHSA